MWSIHRVLKLGVRNKPQIKENYLRVTALTDQRHLPQLFELSSNHFLFLTDWSQPRIFGPIQKQCGPTWNHLPIQEQVGPGLEQPNTESQLHVQLRDLLALIGEHARLALLAGECAHRSHVGDRLLRY